MKLYQQETDDYSDGQYTVIRRNWKFLQVHRFTLLEVYYSFDMCESRVYGLDLILSLLRSGALCGLSVQTHQHGLGVYLFNWSDHAEYDAII